ncbi:MAG: hypothetical protein ABI134_12830 [Byssovorax sp.]
MSSELNRRLFLGGTLALAACSNSSGNSGPPPVSPNAPREGDIPLPSPATTTAEMPMRQLGKTGVKVSAIGLGGFHIGTQKDEAVGSGIILESKTVTPMECIHYAMNLPTSVVIAGCDSMGVLDQAIEAALKFKPLPPEAVTALLDRTRDAARKGDFEKFKTSHQFDGTITNPKWLTTAEV